MRNAQSQYWSRDKEFSKNLKIFILGFGNVWKIENISFWKLGDLRFKELFEFLSQVLRNHQTEDFLKFGNFYPGDQGFFENLGIFIPVIKAFQKTGDREFLKIWRLVISENLGCLMVYSL